MGSKTRTATEKTLRETVVRELERDPLITSGDVSVNADDGVVMLTGFVHSYAEKVAIERAAKRVAGVRAVANDVEVRPGLSRTDPEIARDLVHVLQVNPCVPDEKLEVTVKNGWVTIEGTVDWQFQREATEAAIGHVVGVRGVSDLMHVEPAASATAVRKEIKSALVHGAEVDAGKIRVEIAGGRVKLYGQVRSAVERREAERAARLAPGVAEVENHIRVVS